MPKDADYLVFAEECETRKNEMLTVEQEVALLDEQINTKREHLSHLTQQRANLIAKHSYMRFAQQDASMKFMMDHIKAG